MSSTGKIGEEAPFIGGHKNVSRWRQKSGSQSSPAWGRPAARPGRPGIRPASEAAKRAAGSRPAHRPWAGLAREWAGQATRAGRPDPGLGRSASARWAGRPPEAPGLGPAWARPGRPDCLFFSFSFKFLFKKSSENKNAITFAHELRFR